MPLFANLWHWQELFSDTVVLCFLVLTPATRYSLQFPISFFFEGDKNLLLAKQLEQTLFRLLTFSLIFYSCFIHTKFDNNNKTLLSNAPKQTHTNRVVMLVIHLPINHMDFNHTCHLSRLSPEKLFSFCSLLHSLSIIWKLVRVFIYLSKVHILYACTNFLQGSGPGRS